MSRFTRKIAMRYLRSRRGFVSVVTGFSLAGIMLGVAALIVVMAVMAGFRAELLDKILGTTGHANLNASALTLEKANEAVSQLEKVDGVVRVTPFVGGQAMVVGGNQAVGTLVRGLSREAMEKTPIVTGNLVDGDLTHYGHPRSVLIGRAMADKLSVGAGSKLTLLSPQGSHTVAGFIPRMLRVKVAAVFEVGMFQYDSGLIFLPIETAMNFFDTKPYISAMELMVQDPATINTYRPKVQEVLGDGAVMKDWTQSNRQFFNALKVEKMTMFIILTLIVLVAAFNIITGQMMTVKEKRRDIAILRTMGATRGDVTRIFFTSGFTVGFLGTLLGFALGFALVFNLKQIVQTFEKMTGSEVFSNEVYFLSQLPAKVEWPDMALIACMSLGLSIAASFFPAWRAARMDPVEVLRNE